jgi:hypothetical protein
MRCDPFIVNLKQKTNILSKGFYGMFVFLFSKKLVRSDWGRMSREEKEAIQL